MAPEKHYRDDWAKAKSREVLGRALDDNLLSFLAPEKVTVACFPGIDAEEPKQVYFPRRIPGSNITGFEKFPEIAKQIEANCPEIQVESTPFEKFIAAQSSVNWRVVSLDYTGYFTPDIYGTLMHLRRKQRSNKFILHVANCAKRDGASRPMYYYGYTLETSMVSQFSIDLEASIKNIEERSAKIDEVVDAGADLEEIRNTACASLIKSALLGVTTETLNRLFKFVTAPDTRRTLELCVRHAEDIFGDECGLDVNDPVGSILGGNQTVQKQKYVEFILSECTKQACGTLGLDKTSSWMMFLALLNKCKDGKFFRASDCRRYSYVSESGTPMIGTVYLMEYPTRLVSTIDKIADIICFPTQFQLNPAATIAQLVRLLRQYQREEQRFMSDDEIYNLMKQEMRVEYLGSSAKPVLSKRRAIEEFQGGASVADVKEKYRGWSKKPLSQWKAHVTMGSYDAEINGDSESSSAEPLSKEDAIDLISEGIPLDEIIGAYPGSFTTAQLRAFKAHITMGTYGDIGNI